MRRFFWIFLTANSLGLVLSGCAELDYYRQAVVGQWELLDARRPVVDVLADPATAPALRRRLATARALRMFASVELALPSNGSYHDYADLGRPYAVKNVFAAPELSLEPRRWCYLAVGCLSYRGYFDDEAARRLADQLRTAGDDVFVADIPAYSTLGWFDDPLLNTFIDWPTARLAELMFHELAHQRLYIEGRDSNAILSEVMDADKRGPEGHRRLQDLYRAIDDGDLAGAAELLSRLRERWGSLDPELIRAEGLIDEGV